MDENVCELCRPLLGEYNLLQEEFRLLAEQHNDCERDRAHLKWVIKRQRQMLKERGLSAREIGNRVFGSETLGA